MNSADKPEKEPKIWCDRVTVIKRNENGESATILDDVSLFAPEGESTCIIGPSGSGKSTLVRLFNRLDDPSSGAIYLKGEDISGIDPLLLRKRVAMVMQKPFMFDGTVLANLQRSFIYRGAPLPSAISPEILRVLELARLSAKILERSARSLSGGEQQRVNLARALTGEPELLLLDEPTSALDRPTADHLAATLHDICSSGRLTVIMVTHDLRLAEHTADKLVYLENGKVIETGETAGMLADPKTTEFGLFMAEPAWRKD